MPENTGPAIVIAAAILGGVYAFASGVEAISAYVLASVGLIIGASAWQVITNNKELSEGNKLTLEIRKLEVQKLRLEISRLEAEGKK